VRSVWRPGPSPSTKPRAFAETVEDSEGGSPGTRVQCSHRRWRCGNDPHDSNTHCPDCRRSALCSRSRTRPNARLFVSLGSRSINEPGQRSSAGRERRKCGPRTRRRRHSSSHDDRWTCAPLRPPRRERRRGPPRRPARPAGCPSPIARRRRSSCPDGFRPGDSAFLPWAKTHMSILDWWQISQLH